MSDAHGATTFQVSGEAYDRFVGRYSTPLAVAFTDIAAVQAGTRALDIGCGPGALTAELVRRAGAGAVAAIDPSEPFVAECRRRNAGVDVRLASAEALPFGDRSFDAALAQLVLHFVADPDSAASEMRRVLRPGGIAAACVWDFHDGMRLIRHYWDSALTVDPNAPDEAATMRFGRDGEIGGLFAAAGFRDVTTGELGVEATYADFDDLWAGFTGGPGPAGAFCKSLGADAQARLREELRGRLGNPRGSFTLPARAWYATGRA
jgi:SAM-dependent methyltransferase